MAKRRDDKSVLMVYMPGTDESPIIRRVNLSDVKETAEKLRLSAYDFSIIEGTLLKDFIDIWPGMK